MPRPARCVSAALPALLLILLCSLLHAPIARAGEPCSTSTALSAPAQQVCGESLVLEATVSPPMEGTITFQDGSTDLGAVPVDESGSATLTLPNGLARGTHVLTASFAPLEPCAPSTSPAVEHEVNPVPSTLSLAAPETLACGSRLTMTAVVSPASPGTVTFFDGIEPIATMATSASGEATVSFAAGLSHGSHALGATFEPGAGCTGPSSSNTVNHEVERLATRLSLQVPDTLACGDFVLYASVDPVAEGVVRFFAGGQQLGFAGVGANGTAALRVSGGLPPGTNALHATFTSEEVCVLGSVSDTSVSEVVPTATTTTISSSRNPSRDGELVTFTVQVQPGTAQGTVELFLDGGSIGAATLSQGRATFSMTLAEGSDSLTAFFTGAQCWRNSASPAFTQTVLPPSAASLSIADASVSEGNGEARFLSFTLSITQALNVPLQVRARTIDGSALAGEDYVAADTLVTIPAGSLSASWIVRVIGDQRQEPTEQLTVVLSGPSQGTLADSVATGTIEDDDTPFALWISNASVFEGDGDGRFLSFTLSISRALSGPVHVRARTIDGSALAGEDYVAADAIATIPAGSLSAPWLVQVIGDRRQEPMEQLTVVLSEPSQGTITDSVATGTIYDDDTITLTIGNVQMAEGNEGTTAFVFTARLSRKIEAAASADWTTVDESATAANSDYEPASGTIQFAPFDSVETFAVLVRGDRTFESNETFRISITSATNAVWAQFGGVGTILNDDGAPQIEIDDAVLIEGDAGHSAITFRVRLLTPSSQIVRVNYTTQDGSALANADYLPASGTLTIDPKESEGFITVQVHGDEICEHPGEAFAVRISNPNGGAIVRNTGTGTIVDQDCTAGVGPGALPLLDLAPIRPNPARGVVRLEYALGRDADLTLDILDVQGREVATVARGPLAPGRYQATWSGLGSRGPAPAGLYFARCRGAGKTLVRRFVFTP